MAMRANSQCTQVSSGMFWEQSEITFRDSKNPCWLSIYMKSLSTFSVSAWGCGSATDICTPLQINSCWYSFCLACMFTLSNRISSYLCRSAAGAGGSHWGSSSQLSLTATAQPKTPPAFTASHGPGLPESPPAPTQWLHCHPHTGTVICYSSLSYFSGLLRVK